MRVRHLYRRRNRTTFTPPFTVYVTVSRPAQRRHKGPRGVVSLGWPSLTRSHRLSGVISTALSRPKSAISRHQKPYSLPPHPTLCLRSSV